MTALVSHTLARAELLAEALRDTIAELRLIDAGDMIAYIRAQKWANIADLIQSSTELFFKEGRLSFACMADFSVSWGTLPSISLDMEFQDPAVSAFFTLTIERRKSLVDLKNVWFSNKPSNEEIGTRVFAQALFDARQQTASSSRKFG